MLKIDQQILNIDSAICRNIDKFDAICERGLLSSNILKYLRDFVEHIALKVFAQGNDIEDNFKTAIQPAIAYLKTQGKLKFLSKFHDFLQISTSHYTLGDESAERVMLKYYEYLIKLKKFLFADYGMRVLSNIDKFPINTDTTLKDYYEKIAERVNVHRAVAPDEEYNDRYYIQKIKPFFVSGEIYYEVTFTEATEKVSKFDRIIAFTKHEILKNYSVKLEINHSNIHILDRSMPILLITNWRVSIRPCEIEKFAAVFGYSMQVQSISKEYLAIMDFLTSTGFNLVELIDLGDNEYEYYKNKIFILAKSKSIFTVFDECRRFVKQKSNGANIVRYLLYKLNNKVLKLQLHYKKEECYLLSNLRLKFECIPFDEMPFNSSLFGHNPRLSDLFDCIYYSNRDHELLGRFIKNKTEIDGQLYIQEKKIEDFEEVDKLISTYNALLYDKHQSRRIENYNGNLYIQEYENDAKYIIEQLKELSVEGITNYANSVISWIKSDIHFIDCDEKRVALTQLFEKSRVALIYGSAGTGKSTLINHISHFFRDNKKIFLANTHPAVENLKRKVNAVNCSFMTIAKFISNNNNIDSYCDLIVIDECSTVSNKDMRCILQKAQYKLLVLVGDIFQIESIYFGNWFGLARECIPQTSIVELNTPYRTSNKQLLALWTKVRNFDDAVVEHIAKNDYSTKLDNSIFTKTDEDEIILCLNYDGLYGINNLNRFLQENNANRLIQWGVKTYKVGDPILFNESERFAPLIYNNLKGKIVDIAVCETSIQFDIELEKAINSLEVEDYSDLQLIGTAESGNSIVRFLVNKNRNSDRDNDSDDHIVPFQVAYAVSIHKAQGLEYKSVKIVITDEIDELITHNIFYTAITRAKEKLRIFWSPETMHRVLGSFVPKQTNKDFLILSNRYELRVTKK